MINIELSINSTIDELRANIDLLPHGSIVGTRNLGTIVISNDGSGTNTKGNYNVILYKRNSKQIWKQAKIVDFPRQQLGAYDLLFRALQLTIGSRNK